jgi:hypothetical protein
MNHIRRKKNGGVLLIEPLEKGYNGLNTGDEYVHLGERNKVLLWGSARADDEKIGKVIWDYGVKERESVVNRFDESEHNGHMKLMWMMRNSIYGAMGLKSPENAP